MTNDDMQRPTKDSELVATLLFLSLGDPMTPERKQQILDAHQAVLDRFAELRELLTGRTMHCGMCEDYAKQRDELRQAIGQFVLSDRRSHGGRWSKALDRLYEIAEQHRID